MFWKIRFMYIKSKHMSDFQGLGLEVWEGLFGFHLSYCYQNSKYVYFFHFRTLVIDVWLWNMISLDIIEKYLPWFLCINWFTMGWNLFWCNIEMQYSKSSSYTAFSYRDLVGAWFLIGSSTNWIQMTSSLAPCAFGVGC